MEARNTTPSFTTAIRGYDREEVDEYVDSLAKAMEDLEESEEQNRRLQSHLTRLNARIHELEERIQTETPLTAGALGERITLVLKEAESGAARALEQAEAKASDMVERATTKATSMVQQAESKAAGMVQQAEAKAKVIEEQARTKQAALVSEAERRATARTRQVEEWEQQVVAHTHAQQAYQARVHQEAEDAHEARMTDLAAEHEAAMDALRDVRNTVDRLLQRISASPAASRIKTDEEVRPAAAPEAPVEAHEASRPEAAQAQPVSEQPASGQPASEQPEDAEQSDEDEPTSPTPVVAFDHLADEDDDSDDDATRAQGSLEPMTANFRAVS